MSGASRERFVSPGSDRRALVLAALPADLSTEGQACLQTSEPLGPSFWELLPYLDVLASDFQPSLFYVRGFNLI